MTSDIDTGTGAAGHDGRDADAAKEPYELVIAVTPDDIDEMKHVSNIVFLRWVQDAAIAHWRYAATEAEQAALLWIVVRHEIDYKRPAVEGDIVIARTWIGGSERLRFDRHTEILRARDRKMLAKVVTQWVPIDPKTHRPTNVSDEIRERFSVQSD